jgi:hypothetical protein
MVGCGTAANDPAGYQSAVQLKYETLALIDRMGERYAARKADAETLLRKYAEASQAAEKIPYNQQITEFWQAIRDPRGGSAATVIEVWKSRGPLRPAARAERKRQTAQHFDRLICLESSKLSLTDCMAVGATPTASAAVPQPKPQPKPRQRPASATTPTPTPEPAVPPNPR